MTKSAGTGFGYLLLFLVTNFFCILTIDAGTTTSRYIQINSLVRLFSFRCCLLSVLLFGAESAFVLLFSINYIIVCYTPHSFHNQLNLYPFSDVDVVVFFFVIVVLVFLCFAHMYVCLCMRCACMLSVELLLLLKRQYIFLVALEDHALFVNPYSKQTNCLATGFVDKHTRFTQEKQKIIDLVIATRLLLHSTGCTVLPDCL